MANVFDKSTQVKMCNVFYGNIYNVVYHKLENKIIMAVDFRNIQAI